MFYQLQQVSMWKERPSVSRKNRLVQMDRWAMQPGELQLRIVHKQTPTARRHMRWNHQKKNCRKKARRRPYIGSNCKSQRQNLQENRWKRNFLNNPRHLHWKWWIEGRLSSSRLEHPPLGKSTPAKVQSFEWFQTLQLTSLLKMGTSILTVLSDVFPCFFGQGYRVSGRRSVTM